MVLEDFYNRACLVPLVRVAASLVLDQYSVATLEGGEARACSSHRVRPVTARLESALSRRSRRSDQSVWGR